MADDDSTFTLEDVRIFMLESGGKVKNHQLVTHFKKYLNHPKRRTENREKFKDFVNLLSAIKTEDGEKILVLKKRYRQQASKSDAASDAAWPVNEPQGAKSTAPSYPEKDVEIVNRDYTINPDDAATTDLPSSQSSSSLGVASSSSTNSMSSTKDANSAIVDCESQTQSVEENRSQPTFSTESPRSLPRALSEPAAPSPPVCRDVTDSPRAASEPPEQKEPKTPVEKIKSMESVESESPLSVKDRMRHFNRISSEADMQKLVPQRKRESKLYGANGRNEDDDTGSFGLMPEERQWMILASTSDYHPIAKILLTNPQLAKKKDIITTALHWACKHGKPEVVKLICGYRTQGVDINARSGYTALHLAALHGHEDVVELLVSVYGADVNIRDNSGKRAKQYLSNSGSSKVQRGAMFLRSGSVNLGRHRHKDVHSAIFSRELLWGSVRRPSVISPLGFGDGDNNHSAPQTSKPFTRVGSFSQRVRKTTERFSHLIKRDWGSSENVEVQRKSSVPESPQFERKGSLTKDFMPPPKTSAPKKKKSRKEKSKENDPSDDEMKSRETSPMPEVVMPAKSLYI